ncbi:MAG: sodium:solute symporter family protein [Bacillota bacterium]
MLVAFILLYLAASVAVGLYAARRVRGASDFAVAGRRFGAPIVAATVFATWFGAETVLGIPATFMKEGLVGIVADPFAAVLCLVLVGLFFARPLHRLGIITLGDYFRARYDRPSEAMLSLCIAFSYFGWIAAQLVALGLAFSLLSHGAIGMPAGILAGAAIVLLYTMAGGMWSIALTDFLQAVLIVAGMGFVAWHIVGAAGGIGPVFDAAAASGRMKVLPESRLEPVLAWIDAALIVALGSIPQQDVLQRITSSRTEDVAVRATIAGGIVYFVVASVPIFLVAAATIIDAPMVGRLIESDYQRILPTLVLERAPLAIQVLFFGALISAILSTASGALLAPSVVIAENLARPLFERVIGRPLSDRALLLTMRLTVLAVAVVVTVMALTSTRSIYQLVNESGKVVLVAAFVPLAAALYWPRASALGAYLAVGLGLATWLILEAFLPDAAVPPSLAGLLASILGMGAGSLLRPPSASSGTYPELRR